jgi:hypothetical protein
MSDGNRQRPAIDLDDLERQLRAVAQPKAAPRTLPPEPSQAPFAVKPVFAAKLPESESFSVAEAELVPAPQPAMPPSRPADYDPLAELARIAQSGSDWATPRPISGSSAQAPNPAPAVSAVDALEALLRMDPPVKAPPPSFAPLPPRRIEPEPVPATPQPEPSLLDFAETPPPAAEPAGAYPQAPLYGAAAAEAEPIYAPEGQLPPHDAAFLQEEPQPRSRAGLKLAVALVSVAAIGIGGVFMWRGNDSLPGGGGPRTPPLIKASGEPNKVAPQNPGGMEVPNANQEIFAGSKTPAGPAGPSKVVSSEEQPVDVGQATKPRVILPNGGSAATVPPAPPPPVSTVPRQANGGPMTQPTPAPTASSTPGVAAPGVAALGEPKKVRTVLVRPDGTVIDGSEPTRPPAMSAPQSVMPSSPVPTQTLPPAAAAPPVMGAPPPAIVPVSSAAPAPMPSAVEASPQPAPAGTPLPPRRPAASAVAAAEPAPAVARPTPAPPVLAPAVSAAPAAQPVAAQQASPAPQQTASVGTGDFAVQLAAPPTEQEARSLATRLTQRFGEALAGQEPDIIRAEVNGKTLYRVRVTGLDRESANTMCNRIKSAQGSCFVAKN